MYIYNAKLTRVVDGDTIDAMIDLGFNTHVKGASDWLVSMLGNLEREI